MNDVLTYQQELVWGFTVDALKAVDEANGSLESRATSLAAISGGAATAVAGFSLFAGTPGGSLVAGLVVAYCISSIVVAAIAACVLRKWTVVVVCSVSVEKLYQDYISIVADEAYHRALSEMCEALERNMETNRRKGRCVSVMFWGVLVQLSLLVSAVITNASY